MSARDFGPRQLITKLYTMTPQAAALPISDFRPDTSDFQYSFVSANARTKKATFHAPGELSTEQILFLSNFIKETAFYMEHLESFIGEYLDQFWEDREYAYHLMTDMLIDTLQQQPLEDR